MVYAYQKYTFKTLENYYVLSDEGAYKLGLVLLFRNGLYLPVCLTKNPHVISDEGVYKLGFVLLFRYGLCLSKHLMLSPMKAFTN